MNLSRRQFLAGSTIASVLKGGRRTRGEERRLEADPSSNPYLNDNFAPILEEITADNLAVIGTLPPDLNGMFVRNGPNPQFPPKNNYHWFDGDGMLHGVRIQEGKASYRNRWVRTAAWSEARRAGESVHPSILDPPDMKYLTGRILKGKSPYPNTANTALVWHHGKLLALWEGGHPHEINVPELDTVGPYRFGTKLRHAFTAHPKIDPRSGELIFFGYSVMPPFLQYSVADRSGTIKSTTPIELPRPVMIHDIAITENYTLFIDCPMVFDPAAMAAGKQFIQYKPRFGARIGVLRRHASGDQIRWFPIDPCFIFHIFNAHEEGTEVVLNGCRFPTYPEFVDFGKAAQVSRVEQLAQSATPIAYRWRMNLDTGLVAESPIDDVVSEFPRINDNFTGQRARYGYAVGSEWNRLIKFDFEEGSRSEHPLANGEATGEGVFVPRPNPQSEDDGWLISFTYNWIDETSELRILDARHLAEEPVARIRMPQRVPYGFHALWLDDDVLESTPPRG